jgi:hypothetical protein
MQRGTGMLVHKPEDRRRPGHGVPTEVSVTPIGGEIHNDRRVADKQTPSREWSHGMIGRGIHHPHHPSTLLKRPCKRGARGDCVAVHLSLREFVPVGLHSINSRLASSYISPSTNTKIITFCFPVTQTLTLNPNQTVAHCPVKISPIVYHPLPFPCKTHQPNRKQTKQDPNPNPKMGCDK